MFYAAFSDIDGIQCAIFLRLRLMLFFGEGFRFHMVTSSRKPPSVCRTLRERNAYFFSTF